MDLDQITDPAAYLVGRGLGIICECDTCGQDFVAQARNRYDGGHQWACDECLRRDPGYYLGEGMDPSPEMRAWLADMA